MLDPTRLDLSRLSMASPYALLTVAMSRSLLTTKNRQSGRMGLALTLSPKGLIPSKAMCFSPLVAGTHGARVVGMVSMSTGRRDANLPIMLLGGGAYGWAMVTTKQGAEDLWTPAT